MRKTYFIVICLTGGMEALAFCSFDHLWCGPHRAKASLGGLRGAHLGYHTIHVSCSTTSYKLLQY